MRKAVLIIAVLLPLFVSGCVGGTVRRDDGTRCAWACVSVGTQYSPPPSPTPKERLWKKAGYGSDGQIPESPPQTCCSPKKKK